MEKPLKELRHLAASTSDEAQRRDLLRSVYELAYSIEDSNDTVHRYGYLHLQTAAVKVGFDLGLFKYLVKASNPVSVEQIALETGAEVSFLRRYLRYLASIGAVSETGKDSYSANNVTNNLSQEVTEAGISHCFVTIGPQYQAIPGFLKKTGYQDPTDELHTVFQDAWNTPLHAFAWFSEHPEELRYFNAYMASRREPKLSWLTVYPIENEVKDLNDPTRAIYVNIGGGIGHQCAQFKAAHPGVPGRVILQDLKHSIDKALPTAGVDNMVHNFFEPQPIKGAKFYFLRGVLHNHPDHKAHQVLARTREAMAPDSVLLLDEMVLPETGVNAYAACMDFTMMAAFASSERTQADWRRIIEGAGLRLVETYQYNPSSYESVMDIRLA
ncbi:S-adenosyl-L-methionine-dependent methyltransferase [Xylariaceae sp. FL0255]|nr:S-adenosyl-L-methionine-dependent methyltransferase [Xylariaceae sp. FL0255]